MYEIVVDILSRLVFILDKTGDHLPVKLGTRSLPEYCSVLTCFVPRGIYKQLS